jgi:hypothetical protein
VAGGVPGLEDDTVQIDALALDEGPVRRESGGGGVRGMDAEGDSEAIPDRLGRPDVVAVPVGREHGDDLDAGGGLEHSIRLGGGVDDHPATALGGGDDVDVVLQGSHTELVDAKGRGIDVPGGAHVLLVAGVR